MDKVKVGFVLAAATNAAIVVMSKGLGDNLGAVDPLFSPAGCVLIVLWGAAYLAVAGAHAAVPAVVAVFCVEKAFFAARWALWVSDSGEELPAMIAADFLTGGFFAIYGPLDATYMLFFGWVAWKGRKGPSATHR